MNEYNVTFHEGTTKHIFADGINQACEKAKLLVPEYYIIVGVHQI